MAQDIKKVIVIGAGPAGLLAALRLKRFNKVDIAIYELRSKPTTLGGAVGIPSNGLLLFHRLGLYDELVAHGCLTPNIVLHSTKGYNIGQKSIAGYGKQQLGYSYLRIRRTSLIDILLRAVEQEGISVKFDHKLIGIAEQENLVQVDFERGVKDSADFLLGCDGIHSAVRQLYVDPTVLPTYSGISNIYGLVEVKDLPTAEVANLDDLNATLTADGLLAVTSCRNSPTVMIYWFFSRQVPLPDDRDARDGWEQRGQAETDNLKSLLLQLLGDSPAPWTAFLKRLMRETDSMKFYPVYYLPIDQKWSKGRCLLLGDSAHAMPPHASQGTSMALEDVTLFSNLLKDERQLTIDSLVAKYESIRRPRTSKLLATAHQNGLTRRKIPPWKLSLNEIAFSFALKVFNVLGLDHYGVGQKELAYDVEREQP